MPEERALYGIGRDVTEYKALQHEVLRLDRLNLAAQMAAGISHEIRNPMTTVRGFLQILQSKYSPSDDARYFGLMISELDRANEIITEFLSLTRSGSGPKTSCDLNLIIDSLAPLIRADAMLHNHELAVHLSSIPLLELDENEIRQLILNLTRNALEAMQTQGRLTISTYTEGEHTVLAINDKGPGIPDSILAKLGTPFATTKDQGTGLGLAICYRIAEDHNATIKVDTGPQGTTFYVRF